MLKSSALLFLIALAVGLLWSATRPLEPQTYADTFGADSPLVTHVEQSAGWREAWDGLVLAESGGGEDRAIRGYLLPKREGQRVLLTLEFSQPTGGTNRLHIVKPDPRDGAEGGERISDNQDFSLRDEDITEVVAGEGAFRIYLLATRPAGAGESDGHLLSRFAVTYVPARRVMHWGSLLFFVALAAGAYAVFVLIILPLGWSGMRALGVAPREASRRWRAVLAVALVVAAAAMLGHPEHWRQKGLERFDDFAATGVAALLHDTGYDPAPMFFRSRIRPSLTAWILPWTEFLPHRLATSTFTPSDRQERMFFFYDRGGWAYGRRLFPEMSAFFAVVLLLGVLGLGGLARRAGMSALEAAGVFLWSALFAWLTLYNSISSAANLATTIAAAFVAWRAWREPSAARLALAGLAFSFTILLKETVAVLGLALVLYQGWTSWREGEWRKRLGHFALFWAVSAVVPLVYYGLVLDTGFAELPSNHQLLYYHQQLHAEYEALTLWTALKTYWRAFSVGLPLAALGLWEMARRRGKWSDADRFFACWLAGSLLTLTMPYIFPRFLIFSIPPFAFLAVRGGELLGRMAGLPRRSSEGSA